MTGFSRSVTEPNVKFKFEKISDYAIPPDLSDGLFHFHAVKLPTGCTIKIIGATDPNPAGSKLNDSLKTAKLVIYILAGLAFAILLVAIGSVIYCLCCKQRRATSSNVRV
uniref:Cadherin_C_2 domain-containing protein n=1 Tax=Panagrellus redivivus TaxID=6233 RepID=A0A7E4VGA2_PANRE